MARKKITPYKQITQKDINSIKSLYNTGHFSVTGICDITKRGWGTVDYIIKSGFNLREYKKLVKERKHKANNKKVPTFRPFKAKQSTKVVTVRELPDNAEKIVNSLSNTDDVLNHMWELQQEEAKQIVRKAEHDEAIHKIRNGLQKISEGLGELL